jgi:hypothetical protein
MEQKREHVRIDDFISFDFSIMDREEYEKVKDDYIAKSKSIAKCLEPSTPFVGDIPGEKEPGETTGDIPPSLLLMLANLDRKLDVIIDLLDHDEKRLEKLKEKTRKINISGLGLRFQTEQKFRKGDILELTIDLPLVPPLSIPALGEVVRVDQEKTGVFNTALKFTAIDEDDREKISRYIFQRQRELIRAQKKDG